MNPRKTIPLAISIVLLAGLASATLPTPQGDTPKAGPSASAQPKEKPKAPKPDQPKKPPPSEGGW